MLMATAILVVEHYRNLPSAIKTYMVDNFWNTSILNEEMKEIIIRNIRRKYYDNGMSKLERCKSP